MSKLQNIKAVKQLIAGSHKSQTRTSVGFSDAESTAKKNQKHEVGDIWTEIDPVTGTEWKIEQKKGFRTKTPSNSVRDQILDILKVPSTCPECSSNMYGNEQHLNHRMYRLHTKCFNCVTKEETSIRLKGKDAWEEYSKQIMLANAKGWISDADKEVELLKKSLHLQYVQNAQGDLENWNMKTFFEKIDNDYAEVKESILNNLG